jgi:hypothetical protein
VNKISKVKDKTIKAIKAIFVLRQSAIGINSINNYILKFDIDSKI